MKKIILYIFIILSVLGLSYSTYNIVNYIKDGKNTKEQLKKIEENIEVIEVEESTESESYHMINADFEKLKSINSDVKGWITVEGTSINYPFVQGKDNEYYLKRSFDKTYNSAGWVFLDYKNDLLNDRNNILYAHSMRNKTMFGSLINVLKKEWFNNTDNHIIKLSTEKEDTLWHIFSVYHIRTTNDYIQISFDDQEFEKFINMIKKRSTYNFNIDVTNDDKILTLSTCYNKSERLVLHAKLIMRELKED